MAAVSVQLARNLERMLRNRKAWPACMALPWDSQRRIAIDDGLVTIVDRREGADLYDPKNTIKLSDVGIRAVEFFRAGKRAA